MSEERIDDILAVVLSGGKSRRMGSDKLLLPLGDKTMLEHVVTGLKRIFENVAISISDENEYDKLDLDVLRITDIHKNRGPLGGLYSALHYIESDNNIRGIFLVAADLPFAGSAAAHVIINMAEDADVCVPMDSQGRYEPLFAYYAKTVLPNVRTALDSGINKVTVFYDSINVKVLSEADLNVNNPERLFFNINYPEDYRKGISWLNEQ